MKEQIYARLREMGIAFDVIEHPPAHSAQDCALPAARLNAVIPINLFLCPRRQSAYFLLLAHPQSHLHTASVSRQAGSSRLSFASPEALEEKLHAKPGSANPMGLLFPEGRDVTLLMDEKLRVCARLAFHPCENDASLAMSSEDFEKIFLPHVGKTPLWVDMEE